jgi:hypothetical protein
MYKKIQRLWFKKPILFSIFVKKLNYVLIFKTNYKRNPTRNQGCCFHTFNVPEELKSKYVAGQYLNLRLTLDGRNSPCLFDLLFQKVVNYVSQ